MTATRFLVRRTDVQDCRVASVTMPTENTIREGQVVLRVERFGFSANNITYVSLGETMHYWAFFPVDAEWGCIPVWGFATVAISRRDGMEVGDRFFGYWPMGSHALVEPSHVSAHGFVDGASHRAALPAVYNQYQRVSAASSETEYSDAAYMLLRPLFVTSFMLDDFLDEHAYFGAETLIVSSASSKTAYALAFLVSRRPLPRPTIVGLTSSENVAFVTSLGCYDRVLTYEDVETLDATQPAVYTDFSGSAALRARVHGHFDTSLRHSAAVGLTDWDALTPADGFPGAKAKLFFAPAQIKRRSVDWGPGGIEQRVAGAWDSFLPALAQWMTVAPLHGSEAALHLYREMLNGRSRPRDGYTLSL